MRPLVLLLALPVSAEPLLEPKDTVAVVAGVLEWEHKGFESYPKEGRKDAELYAVLGSLGVEKRTLLLDEQATRPAMLGALREAVAASGPESTLLFYFAGHGVKAKDGSVAFAGRDMDPWKHETGLRLSELEKLFVDGGKRLFRGKRVVLLADCCHSGALAATAKALSQAGIEAVSLTSADASNTSTGNWTFTRTVLEALRGGARCDADGDGAVTLAELAEETRLAMKHREDQRYGYANHGVPPGAAVSKAARERGERAPQRWALAPRGGRDEPARVLALEKERARVAFYGYADETQAWVPRSALKPHDPATYPVGARLSVDWDGQDYLAEVLKVEDGLHFITYPGWGPEWDEWVGHKRINGTLAPGEQAARPLKVQWQGSWWDAALKGRKGELYCVRYLGYDASWDECVPAARARF